MRLVQHLFAMLLTRASSGWAMSDLSDRCSSWERDTEIQ